MITAYDIIGKILAGGLLGMLGQGIRIAVGLKKLNDSNRAQAAQGNDTEAFSASRLILSIFIGFIAGAIAIFVKGQATSVYSNEFIMAIIATGYSGADFIEGVFNTYIPKTVPSTDPAGNNGASNNAAMQQPLIVEDESISTANKVLG